MGGVVTSKFSTQNKISVNTQWEETKPDILEQQLLKINPG